MPREWTEIVISYDNTGVFERNGPAVQLTNDAFAWFYTCMDSRKEWHMVHNPGANNAAFNFLNANDAMRFKLTWGGK